MDPIASAGKKPVDEQTLHSLGWTFHAESQTWNFHSISRPCLSRQPALLDDILKAMWTTLVKSMANIEDNMKALGVPIPEPIIKKVPISTHSSGAPKRPGLEYPKIGAPDEFHKLLDTAVDAARKQGTRVNLSVDPNQGQAFDPLKTMERMLSNVCPNCGGRHGC